MPIARCSWWRWAWTMRGQIAHICSFARPDMGLINNVGCPISSASARARTSPARKPSCSRRSAKAASLSSTPTTIWPISCAIAARLGERGVKEVDFSRIGRACGRDAAPSGPRMSRSTKRGVPHFMLVHARIRSRNRAYLPAAWVCAASTTSQTPAGPWRSALHAACPHPKRPPLCPTAQPEAGRQEVKRAACGAVVFDDAYNASPASMEASLAMLASYKAYGRKIAVLGDMGELGPASVEGHRAAGRAAAQAGVDLLVCVGEASPISPQALSRPTCPKTASCASPMPPQAVLALKGNRCVGRRAGESLALSCISTASSKGFSNNAQQSVLVLPHVSQVFLGFVLAAAITMVLMPAWIKLLTRTHIGQQVRADGPQSHLVKQGTPTMGGVIMIVAIVTTVFAGGRAVSEFIAALVATLAIGALGSVRRRFEGHPRALVGPDAEGQANRPVLHVRGCSPWWS